MNVTEFNKEEEYGKEIEAKIQELKLICNDAKIPMFVTVCMNSSNEETVYKSDVVGSKVNNIILKDDLIADLINVMNGFRTVPPHSSFEMEMDQISDVEPDTEGVKEYEDDEDFDLDIEF